MMLRQVKAKPLLAVPLVVTLVLALLVTQLSAQSFVVPAIGFEIDGDVAINHGGERDWQENTPFPPAVLIADPNSKATTDPTTFRPDSKFDKPDLWSIVPGQVGPGQNELTNVLAWGILPGDLGNNRPDHYWLVLGMERTKQEGTFDLDFEFNQQPWTDLSRGPIRTPGDIAVGFELKGNPVDRQKDLQVLFIQYMPGAQPSLCQVTPGNGGVPAQVVVGTDPCPPYGDSGWYYRYLANGEIFSDSGLGQATMNDAPFAVPVSPPFPVLWPSTDAQGNPRTEIGPFQFAEAAIDLTAFGIEAQCATFSTVHAKSRSSLQVTSDLKDLARPVDLKVSCRLDGHKFLDVNGNGSWDKPAEPPLEGWEIGLSNGSTTTTDADGYYEFKDLTDGTYTVTEVCPDAWAQTKPGFTDFAGCGTETYTAAVDLYHREVKDLDFGNGRPELTIAKMCPAAVFLGDTIDYSFTVTNTGNVLLKDIAVDDPAIDFSTMITLTAGESKTFTATVDSLVLAGHRGSGRYVVFLPLVLRGAAAAPAQEQSVQEAFENTVTATSQYALATVTASDSCTTQIYELEVSKSAQTSFKRTYHWLIDKAVDNAGPFTVLPGASVTPKYTVTVDLQAPPYIDSDWAVQGTISVTNPAPMPASLASVADLVSPAIVGSVSCPSLTVPAGDSLTCTYGPVALPDTATRTNTATATLINNNGRTTDFSGSAGVVFTEASMQLIDEEVQVFDQFWNQPPNLLGTVRFDQVPVTFPYTRTIQAPGTICELIQVPNVATLKTNDTNIVISDTNNIQVQILELCTLTVGYEDLPLSLINDWDYNDWIASVDLLPTWAAGDQLLRMDLAIDPEAHGAAYNHEFWLRLPPNTFACTGTYTRTLMDGNGVTLDQVSGVYNPSSNYDLRIFPSTVDAFPAGVTNTDERFAWVAPTRKAMVSVAFDAPCPFTVNFDPNAIVHGEGMFFSTRLHVLNTGENVNPGDGRTLYTPVAWMWPQESVAIWLAYPDVLPGEPPIFTVPWWQTHTSLVYDRKP
jgi:SdrD B-like domain